MKTVLILVLLILTGYGKLRADMTRAELIPSPLSGYKCFAIYNADGIVVGGSCVKE